MMLPTEDWLLALGRASLMLAISAVLVQGALWLFDVTSARVHRLGWICVLLQGVIFFQLRVGIPSVESGSPASSIITTNLDVNARANVRSPSHYPEIENGTLYSHEIMETVKTQTSQLSHPVAASKRWSWPQIAACIWLVGATVLTGGWLGCYVYFVRKLTLKAPLATWEQEWLQLLSDLRISKSIKLGITPDVGPALCILPSGFHVLVPESAWRKLTPEERLAVLRHEVAHYQRGDLWKTISVRLLVFAHWFNFVAWWAARKFQICGEWLCDDDVTHALGPLAYSRALMRLGETDLRPVHYGNGVGSGHLFQCIRRVLVPESDSVLKRYAMVVIFSALFLFGICRFELVAQQASPPDLVVQSNDKDPRDASTPTKTSVAIADPSSPTQKTTSKLPAGAHLRLGTRILRQPTTANHAVYSPDGNILAVCGHGLFDSGSSVCLWNTRTGAMRVEIRLPVASLAFSPKGRLLAGGDSQGRIHIWDASSGEINKVLNVKLTAARDLQDLRVYAVAFLDEKTLVSVHRRGMTAVIRRWNTSTGEELPRFQKLHDGQGTTPVLAVSADRKLLACGLGKSVQVWNLESSDRPVSIESAQLTEIHSLNFADDSRVLVLCGPTLHSLSGFTSGRQTFSPNLEIWELPGVRERKFSSAEYPNEYILNFAVDHGRNRLVVVTYKSVQVWDLAEGKVITRIPHDRQRSVAIDPSGKQLAVIGAGSKIELIDVESGKPLFEDPPAHNDKVAFVAYAPDGKRVVTAGQDNVVHLWDAESGRHLRQLPGFKDAGDVLNAITFSPNGQVVAELGTCSEPIHDEPKFGNEISYVRVGAAQLVAVETGEIRQSFRFPQSGSCVAISSDSKTLAVTSVQREFRPRDRFGLIHLFDLGTGKEVRSLQSDGHQITALAYSDQSFRLWATTKNAKVIQWNAESGDMANEYTLPTERADQAVISGISQRGVTLPGWPVAQIWDLSTGKLLRDIESPRGLPGISIVALSRDGSKMAMGTELRMLSVHDVSNGKTILEALELPSRPTSLAFSPDSKHLISGMEDASAIIWSLSEPQ